MGGMEVGQVAQAPAITSRAVNAERSLENIISSIFRWAVRPLVSLYCALENKILTGKPLTTTNVLPDHTNYRIERCDSVKYDLLKFAQEVKNLKNGSQIVFHLECQNSLVPHSTALVVGKDTNGNYYALFFNANGTSPEKSKLGRKEFVSGQEEQTINLETPAEFYQKMMEGVEKPPELLYSSADIQADRVSCTAYTAVFLNEVKKAAKESMFAPETFMQDVANGRLVTHAKARAKLSETAKKVAPWSSDAKPDIISRGDADIILDDFNWVEKTPKDDSFVTL